MFRTPNQPTGQAGNTQNQLPAQGANAQGNAPAGNAQGNAPVGNAQGNPAAGNAQNPGPAKGADPNIVTTKGTDPGGFEWTKKFDRTTGLTQKTSSRTDPETGESVVKNTTTDKSGKVIKETAVIKDPTDGGGQRIIKLEGNQDGITKASTTEWSPKGDSAKTTNLDPKTGFKTKTSDTILHTNGSTSTVTYSGNCPPEGGPACHLVSAVDTDPKTGKMTTTKYDPQSGKVVSTQVSDIPKDAKTQAAMLKAGANTLTANTKPQGLTGANQNVAGQAALPPADNPKGQPPVQPQTKNPDGSTTTADKKSGRGKQPNRTWP